MAGGAAKGRHKTAAISAVQQLQQQNKALRQQIEQLTKQLGQQSQKTPVLQQKPDGGMKRKAEGSAAKHPGKKQNLIQKNNEMDHQGDTDDSSDISSLQNSDDGKEEEIKATDNKSGKKRVPSILITDQIDATKFIEETKNSTQRRSSSTQRQAWKSPALPGNFTTHIWEFSNPKKSISLSTKRGMKKGSI